MNQTDLQYDARSGRAFFLSCLVWSAIVLLGLFAMKEPIRQAAKSQRSENSAAASATRVKPIQEVIDRAGLVFKDGRTKHALNAQKLAFNADPISHEFHGRMSRAVNFELFKPLNTGSIGETLSFLYLMNYPQSERELIAAAVADPKTEFSLSNATDYVDSRYIASARQHFRVGEFALGLREVRHGLVLLRALGVPNLRGYSEYPTVAAASPLIIVDAFAGSATDRDAPLRDWCIHLLRVLNSEWDAVARSSVSMPEGLASYSGGVASFRRGEFEDARRQFEQAARQARDPAAHDLARFMVVRATFWRLVSAISDADMLKSHRAASPKTNALAPEDRRMVAVVRSVLESLVATLVQEGVLGPSGDERSSHRPKRSKNGGKSVRSAVDFRDIPRSMRAQVKRAAESIKVEHSLMQTEYYRRQVDDYLSEIAAETGR